ncbi:hypothetical protein [Geopseudomonas aromaticivorans]
MANQQEKNNAGHIAVLIGFLAFIPMLAFSLIRYRQLRKAYSDTPHSQRVFDTGNLTQPFIAAGTFVVATFFATHFALDKAPYVLTPIVAVIALYVGYKIARSVSTNYFGVYVDSANDRVVFPEDLGNLSLGEILRLKIITRLGEMDEVPLSGIKRITRQSGTKLFIHGQFGSRAIKYSDKQKRDECISAIQHAGSVSSPIEFESA